MTSNGISQTCVVQMSEKKSFTDFGQFENGYCSCYLNLNTIQKAVRCFFGQFKRGQSTLVSKKFKAFFDLLNAKKSFVS